MVMARGVLSALVLLPTLVPAGVLLECESFDDLGGWAVDQQFMDQMGSTFLLAHGMGRPVADAVTSVELEAGPWTLWVRTRDWVASQGPGKFRVSVGDFTSDDLGVGNGEWHWERAGTVRGGGRVTVRLHDLTGFEGRVDALFLSRGQERPPLTWEERKRLLGLGQPVRRTYDLVVAGGGIAGMCAAVAAARDGARVALVQDRAVFGGNASSEVRVHVFGSPSKPPYPHNGDVLKEILKFADRTAGACARDNWRMDDRGLSAWLGRQPRLDLFPLTRVVGVQGDLGRSISAVVGRGVVTGAECVLKARLFVDATGDASVAVAAGAEWRDRPETAEETGESLAPAGGRLGGGYGSSLYFFPEKRNGPSAFPDCPWALRIDRAEEALLAGEDAVVPSGGWNWETGFDEDNVAKGELIRDRLFRAIYGTWDYAKNRGPHAADFSDYELYWVGIVLGKRAARRIVGDYLLTEQDLTSGRTPEDGVVTTDTYVDLHFPHPRIVRKFGRDCFRSTAYDAVRGEDRVDAKRYVGGKVEVSPCEIPYRCLYSRNVKNLLMAGKNISATHVAMGSVRVMHTGGAIGTVVGRSAALCIREGVLPRALSSGTGLKKLKDILAAPLPAAGAE